MWDVTSSVIFCSSCILLLPRICCICFSNPFFVTLRTPVTTGIVVAFIPHIVSISISRSLYFDSFDSYFNWSILFGGGGHINKQAAFFLFVLDNDVCFVGLYLGISQYLQDCDVVSLVLRPVRTIWVTRVGLKPSATVWGSCSYHFSFPALWNLLSYVKILNWKKIYARFHSRKQPDLVATIFSRRSRLWEPLLYL